MWRQFRHPTTLRLKAVPTHVEFSPVAPHDVAVASSLQVDIFSTQTNAVYRTLTRFKDIVHCASYRHDGKVLAAGDERGCTQLFDLGSRAVMRTFHGHERAVHVARFSPDSSQLFTASDDHRALCWDVTAESQLRSFDGHEDFVRSGALSPSSPNMFVTGSYDHTVRLWDVNSKNCIMTLNHTAPVEVSPATHDGAAYLCGAVHALPQPLTHYGFCSGCGAPTWWRYACDCERKHADDLGHPQRWAGIAGGQRTLEDDHVALCDE